MGRITKPSNKQQPLYLEPGICGMELNPHTPIRRIKSVLLLKTHLCVPLWHHSKLCCHDILPKLLLIHSRITHRMPRLAHLLFAI